jgi:hypothetical protein
MTTTLETLTTESNFRIPASATLIDFERDTVSMYQPNDTSIERLTLEAHGHPVQIIRYDGDNRGVAVGIDGPFGSVASMPMDEVSAYIEQHTGGEQ